MSTPSDPDPPIDPLPGTLRPGSVPDLTRTAPNAAADTRPATPFAALARLPDLDHFPGESFPAIAGYEILSELGRGAMGVVYHARDVKLNRAVALKMVLGADRADPKALIRFLAEAEAVAAVKHPHVIDVYEYGECDGRPYLAMEFAGGGTLRQSLRDGPAPGPAAVAALVGKVARGVAAAHALGIVHRDLKPGNVLLTTAGEPKVSDFGLAKRPAGADLTDTKAVMGTPAYMAPEQAKGESKFVGPQADVWALGVILYECLTGVTPFGGDDAWAVLHKVLVDDPDPPRRRQPAVPRDLDLICLKCLAKDPADRYPTAAALADDLDRYAGGETVSVRPAGPVERAAKWARRKPSQAVAYGLAAVAALLLAVGAGFAGLWHRAAAARDQAATERAQAVAARQDAETARDGERAAKDALAVTTYARSVALAYQQLRGGQPAAAGRMLDSCRPDLRGWEWDFLRAAARQETFALTGHQGAVYAVAFRPGGRQIATAGQDGTVRVWDAGTGAELARLADARGPVYGLAFSPDGTWLAAGGEDATVRVWDPDARAVVRTLRGPGEVTDVAVSPDGKWVAAGRDTGKVHLWDAAADRPPETLDAHDKPVSAVAFSPDGKRLATASFDRTARVWDAATRKPVGRPLVGHDGEVVAVCFGPTARPGGAGPRPVYTSGQDGAVRVWDADTGAVLRKWPADPGGPAGQVTVSPDGNWVVVGGANGAATLWLADGTRDGAVRGHAGQVGAVAISPDGRRLATGGNDGAVRVWDRRSAADLGFPAGTFRPVTAVAFTPDGRRVAVAYGSRFIDFTDATPVGLTRPATPPTAIPLPAPPAAPGTGPKKAYRPPDRDRLGGAFVAHQARVPVTPPAEPAPPLPPRFDERSGGGMSTTTVGTSGNPGLIVDGPLALGLRPDGPALVVVPHLGDSYLWESDNGPRPPPAHKLDWPAVTGVAAGTFGGRLRGATAKSPTQLTAAAVAPDGRWVAGGRADGAIALWDVETRRPLRSFAGHAGPVGALAVSPDGKWLASAGFDHTARVWDTATGAGRLTLVGHTGEVLAAVFAPGGGWLVTAGADHTARVWDAATGAERAVLRGHTGPVAAVAVSPDGSRIATGGFDGAVRLWDADRQTEVLAITNRAGWAVRCLAFSPDGGKLAAGGTWGATVYSRSPVERPLFPPVPPRPNPFVSPPKEMPKAIPPAAPPPKSG